MTISRAHQRPPQTGRPAKLELGVMKFADGSAQIEVGDTRVLVGATVEARVPPFLIGQDRGWATAEYAMLPRSTPQRSARESTRGRPSGRSQEIQRLIGRSLRAVLDLTALPEKTLIVDCDVLQADGGTRTASITGAYAAAVEALASLFLAGDLKRWPVTDQLAAISVGIVDGQAMLDLDALEDQSADVDMNVVATGGGRLVEVQVTGETRTFTRREFDGLLDLAFEGIAVLMAEQDRVLAPLLADVRAVDEQGTRRPTPPKSEKDLWDRPK